MSKTTNCPLCGHLDGVSHITGGCHHDTMGRMYTARHNSTGRLLLRAISKGDLGTDLVMADLGSAEKCEIDGLLSSQGARRNSNTSSITTLGGTPDWTSSFYADGIQHSIPYQNSSSNTAKIPNQSTNWKNA